MGKIEAEKNVPLYHDCSIQNTASVQIRMPECYPATQDDNTMLSKCYPHSKTLAQHRLNNVSLSCVSRV